MVSTEGYRGFTIETRNHRMFSVVDSLGEVVLDELDGERAAKDAVDALLKSPRV